MVLKLSALVMLGLACASCATQSSLQVLQRSTEGQMVHYTARRSNGGVMVTTFYTRPGYAGSLPSQRQADRRARAVGCPNGNKPLREGVLITPFRGRPAETVFYRCS